MRSELFAASNMAPESDQPGLRLQNSKLLKVELCGEVYAAIGSMVAYQGDVQFQAPGYGGVAKFLKQRLIGLTGELVPLMKILGEGDVFLAAKAADIYLIDLEGPHDGLTLNGANVLAFEPTLQWEIALVHGAGMFSVEGGFTVAFTGPGRIAVTCAGTPVILRVDQPTYADPHAVVCWSTSLQTDYQRADQLGPGALRRHPTGEIFTMSFEGQGFVVVQPAHHRSALGARGMVN